jgi:hypothetical protein
MILADNYLDLNVEMIGASTAGMAKSGFSIADHKSMMNSFIALQAKNSLDFNVLYYHFQHDFGR